MSVPSLGFREIPEEELKLYHIFGDETCQDPAGKEKHDFMALGTTSVADEHLQRSRTYFLAWKQKLGLRGEIKWKRTDKGNVDRYKKMVTAYFSLLDRGILEFHAMTIPKAGFDERLGDDVPVIAYNRCFHHLLLWKYCDRSIAARKYFVLFDERESSVAWEPFRLAICRAGDRRRGTKHWPFRRMGYEKSHLDIILQVNDLILGAVGFFKNDKHLRPATANSPKGSLAQHVKKTSGFRSLVKIPFHSKRFTVLATDAEGGGDPCA